MVRFIRSRRDRFEEVVQKPPSKDTGSKAPRKPPPPEGRLLFKITSRDDGYDYETLKEELQKISLEFDQIDLDEVDRELQEADGVEPQGHPGAEDVAEGDDASPEPQKMSAHQAGYAERKVLRDQPCNRDPFLPSNFEENQIPKRLRSQEGQSDTKPPSGETNLRSHHAQVDLCLILRHAGCPLYLHDTIIDWIEFHTKRDTKDDRVFDQRNLVRRETLLRSVAEETNMSSRAPVVQDVKLPSDNRLISISKFSFISEFLSIFYNDDLMQD